MKLQNAVKTVLGELDSLSNEEFFSEIDKHKNSELTSLLLKANSSYYFHDFSSWEFKCSFGYKKDKAMSASMTAECFQIEYSKYEAIDRMSISGRTMDRRISGEGELSFDSNTIPDDYCPYQFAA